MTLNKKTVSAVLLAAVMTAGCVSTAFVIEAFYNRLDNILIREFEKYADFDPEQKAWIEESVTEFMAWHRAEQLPAYADFLVEIRDRIVLRPDVEIGDITWMMDHVLELSDRGFEQFPFLQSIDLMRGLTDEQVRQVAERTDKEYEKYRKRFEENRSSKKRRRGVDRADSFLKRVGLDLTDEQKDIIAEGLEQRYGNYEEDLEIWYSWAGELIQALERRSEPGFDAEATRLVSEYPRLMQIYRPEEWWHNYEVDSNTLLSLFRSLDDDQRTDVAAELTRIAGILVEISATEDD